MRTTAWEVALKYGTGWRTKKFPTRKEALAYFARSNRAGHVSPLASRMKNVRQLIVWAKAQSESLKVAASKSHLNLSNIYLGRSEWIDFELLPKLREIQAHQAD